MDFLMYELLDINSCLEPSVLDDFENLKAFHARVHQLPTVAAYINSDKFLAKPFNGKRAAWGGN